MNDIPTRKGGSRPAVQSDSTRAKLISVAEHLFAERGVDGVTLNEIGKAAEQRNSAACHYHFGSKEGLLQAILDKHTPGIADRRHAILDEVEHAGDVTLRIAVHAYVAPVAEKLEDPDGGREFIRINAQLLAAHAMYFQHLGPYTLRVPQAMRLNKLFTESLAQLKLPKPIIDQRMLLGSVMLFHGLADHIRIVQMSSRRNPSNNTALFVANLEDAITAMFSMPVSEGTQPLLP